MKYRNEIDGLRALAVIPVILFHAKFPFFNGGYLGVDIFFVISGYLITTYLVESLDSNTFSLVTFYEKRIRRIFPALFFVLFCCIPFAITWMFPDQLKLFSQGIISVVFFVSNFFFWLKSGYFEPSAEENPLLHTWSLAVEEQFYVLFPLLLLMLWKKPKAILYLTLTVLIASSLLFSQKISTTFPNANFYLLPSRTWELLTGTCCALILRKRTLSSQILALVGFIFVVYSLLNFSKEMHLPNAWSLVPVVGTAMIILFAGEKTITARILSVKIITFLGLISYSAYLWHQPIFAFARIRSLEEPNMILMLALCFLTLLLASLTWKYIEQPFRIRKEEKKIEAKRLWQIALSSSVALLLVGSIGITIDSKNKLESLNSRFLVDVQKNDPEFCHFNNARFMDAMFDKCSASVKNKKDILLIGDSHANVFSYPLYEHFLTSNIAFSQFTINGCLPFITTNVLLRNCNSEIRALRKQAMMSAETIIISANWSALTNKEHYIEHQSNYLSEITNGIKELLRLDKKVILIYPVPIAPWAVPMQLEKLKKYSQVPKHLSINYSDFASINILILNSFNRLKHKNLSVIKPHKTFCNSYVEKKCVFSADDIVFYKDTDHLSLPGTKLLMPNIIHALNMQE